MGYFLETWPPATMAAYGLLCLIGMLMLKSLGLDQKGKKEHRQFAIWSYRIVGVLMIAGSIAVHIIWFETTFDTFISFFCRTLFLTLVFTALLYALLKPVQIYQRRKSRQEQAEKQP
jgi:apolipoprotein N-acyltransferase